MDKTAWIHQVRCTETERAAIDALAERDAIKFPEALRQLVREGAKAAGVWPIAQADHIIDIHHPYDPDAPAPGYRKTADGVFVAEAAE